MRRIASIFAGLILLALPASAAAHVDFYSVTLNIDPNGYHEDITGNIPVDTPACGSFVTIAPGEVHYIKYETGHFGIGGVQPGLHIHQPTGDYNWTNLNLRQFDHPLGSGTPDQLGVRYSITLTIPAFGVTWDVVRARNNSSSLAWAVRRNC
jgi:hypothetical protein